jgi:hypothetical protein
VLAKNTHTLPESRPVPATQALALPAAASLGSSEKAAACVLTFAYVAAALAVWLVARAFTPAA